MTKRVIKGGQTIPRMRGQSVLENNTRLDKVVFVIFNVLAISLAVGFIIVMTSTQSI